MEPEEAEDYEQTPTTLYNSFQNRPSAIVTIKEENIDVSHLFSNNNNNNFNGISNKQFTENVSVLAGLGGRVRWKRPQNGVCELCNLRISASNWSRHLKRKHADNLKNFLRSNDRTTDYVSALATSLIPAAAEQLNLTCNSGNNFGLNGNEQPMQQQTTKSVIAGEQHLHSLPKMNRLFTLFVATSGLSASDLENEFLARFLASIPNFKLPESSMETQMNEELRSLVMKIGVEMRSASFPIAISAQTALSNHSNTQKPFIGICAHFWDNSRQDIYSVGFDVIPLTERHISDDFYDTISKKLKEFDVIPFVEHYVTNDGAYMRPSFFKPNDLLESSAMASREEMEEFHFVETDCAAMDAFYSSPWADQPSDEKLFKTTCASAKLNYVLREICEKDATLIALKNRVFEVLRNIVYCQFVLKSVCKQKLLFPADSQWRTLYLTYSRILDVLDHLNAVCIDYCLPTICADDVSTLREIVNITTPFEKFANKLEQENKPTISLLYPGLLHLLQTLEPDNCTHLPSIRPALKKKLEEQFSNVLKIDSADFDSIYLCSSILDPTVAFIVSNEKTAAVEAIRNISGSILKDVDFQVSDNSSSTTATASTTGDLATVESPFGFGTVVKPKQQNRNRLDVEIANYLTMIEVIGCTNDPIHFWNINTGKFPLLSRIAKTVLSFPATSAPARKLISFGLQRNRNANVENVRRKALLCFNRSLITI